MTLAKCLVTPAQPGVTLAQSIERVSDAVYNSSLKDRVRRAIGGQRSRKPSVSSM